MPIESPVIKPHGFTIFCDDLREEVTGKTTYVGVYGDVLFVADALPMVLPKLCFVIHFFGPANARFENLKIKIAPPGTDTDNPPIVLDVPKTVVAPNIDVGDEPQITRAHLVIMTAMSPCTLEKFGRFRISADWDGEYITLGSLTVAPASNEQKTK